MSKKIRIVLTGGGSGGHIYPLLAVAEDIRNWANDYKKDVEITYMGPKDNHSLIFVQKGFDISHIVSGKIRRYFSFQNFLDIPKLFIGFLDALIKLYFIMPDAVFSKGGTGAFPVVLAASFYRIPIIIHESDARPGLTNLVSSYFAKKIFVSFPSVIKYFNPNKTEVTGTPVREELLQNRTTKEAAREMIGFASSSPLIFIYGGSQGSKRINNIVLENLKDLLEISQIIHQTGELNFNEVQKISNAILLETPFDNRYEVVPYLTDDLRSVFDACDLVIGRAGSATIFEIAAFGKASILIPLKESANDHQKENAYAFAQNGASIILEEDNLFSQIFMNEIKKIILNENIRIKMENSAKQFFMPDATDKISEGILKIALKKDK
jgi:UDP-N-acetylglucosamine--N-acetylmuramyl-(pentapeptide) pyrophosphoryl-undecaprenol N-acetylglucosamine transferase